ncbi:hypothetical protein GCM10027291_08740 [Telluribacter humicola]
MGAKPLKYRISNEVIDWDGTSDVTTNMGVQPDYCSSDFTCSDFDFPAGGGAA